MNIATLEKLDLGTFEKVCRVLFDQMGFVAKTTGAGAMPGIGAVMVLYSKSSNAPFALLQCAVSGARVEVAQLTQIKNSMSKQGVSNGYLVTVETVGPLVSEFAAANKISLVDGAKFVELISNLSETGRNLLRDTLAPQRASRPSEVENPGFGTGRYPKLVGTGGPPTCAKCGGAMKLQVKRDGQYQTGKYWQCVNSGCGYISAYI